MPMPVDFKAADEMIRSEMARVGIAVSLDELSARDTERDETRSHWTEARSDKILEDKAIQIIDEARKAFREWSEAKRKMESNFDFGRELMERAAANLRDAAILARKKSEVVDFGNGQYAAQNDMSSLATGKKPGEA